MRQLSRTTTEQWLLDVFLPNVDGNPMYARSLYRLSQLHAFLPEREQRHGNKSLLKALRAAGCVTRQARLTNKEQPRLWIVRNLEKLQTLKKDQLGKYYEEQQISLKEMK